MKKISPNLAILILFVLIASTVLWSNLVRSFNFGINPNDFSIYQQAIYELAHGPSWNPLISIRGLKIFNDHFDPIIILAAGFVKLFGAKAQTLLVFEWLWYLSLFALWYFLGRFKTLLDNKFLLGASLILFSRSLLQGIEFPIHPTTWSMVPAFLMGYFLVKKNRLGLYLSGIALCFFRESLPFSLVGLSGYFLLNKNWKHFLGFFGLGVVGTLFVLVLRPQFLGPTVNYGNTLVSDLISGHIPYVWTRLIEFNFPLKVFALPLVLIGTIIHREVKSARELLAHPIVGAIFMGFPLFFVHMLKNYLAHHHSIPMLTAILAVFLFSQTFQQLRLKSKTAMFLVLLAFFTASSRYTRYLKMIFGAQTYASEAKKSDFKQIQSLVAKIPLQASLIATGGVVAQILRPGQQIYQFDENTPILEKGFDYMLLEKKEPGDLIPVSVPFIQKVAENCRPQISQTLFESDYFLFAKGPFFDSCLGLEKRWPGKARLLP